MIEVSARHCHLSQHDLDVLFGKGHQLKLFKKLSQHSDFASSDVITIENLGNKIENIRIVGPPRKKRNIEISKTDARYLKINPEIKIHETENDVKINAVGPKGEIKVPVIIKQRHVHMSDKEAESLGLKAGDKVKVHIGGPRAVTFENVIVRTDPLYKLSVHLDTDEGNAAGIDGIGEGELII
ncbi:MAG: PduL/EutD family phosphate acyltransferase [candidate division WOR-3 bacterium]